MLLQKNLMRLWLIFTQIYINYLLQHLDFLLFMGLMEDLTWFYLNLQNNKGRKETRTFNSGNHYRDFTYVEDIVEAIVKLIPKPSKKVFLLEIYNLGSSKPIFLKNI